jgi:hypothetical protein
MRFPFVLFQPQDSDRVYEVELKECPNDGSPTLYVGGIPVLYLDSITRKITLLNKEKDDETGLLHNLPGFPLLNYMENR